MALGCDVVLHPTEAAPKPVEKKPPAREQKAPREQKEAPREPRKENGAGETKKPVDKQAYRWSAAAAAHEHMHKAMSLRRAAGTPARGTLVNSGRRTEGPIVGLRYFCGSLLAASFSAL